ncbi:transposase [Abyssibacter profundi]|uniref:Transposase n=1 Tax=Abyssibacter profundi TaxID=2182787 RepID=A0A363UNE3_9GAMM|nr:transposase [Abyssibacter profundi]MBV61425.1 transposase [Nevskiales bacterium]PWN56960.1 transposase [Abyssibacter profundi]
MARLPRIIVPDYPDHVTHRGNRRQRIFLVEDDYAVYRDMLAENCRMHGVEVWSYCFMPNHVHLILTPSSSDGLSRAVGETHRRYSGFINARLRVTGHLFQGRFGSVAMDEAHLYAAFRYVAMNPVKANLVERPEAWPWSSTPAYLAGRDDSLVTVKPFLDRIENPQVFFSAAADEVRERNLASGQSIGRPLVDDDTLAALEKAMGIQLRPRKRGRPRKEKPDAGQVKFTE